MGRGALWDHGKNTLVCEPPKLTFPTWGSATSWPGLSIFSSLKCEGYYQHHEIVCSGQNCFEKEQNKNCKTTQTLGFIIIWVSEDFAASVSSGLSIEHVHQIQIFPEEQQQSRQQPQHGTRGLHSITNKKPFTY